MATIKQLIERAATSKPELFSCYGAGVECPCC